LKRKDRVFIVCVSVRIGCWNEAPWSADYIVTLRHSLDKAGLNDVKITAADGSTTVIAAAAKNKTLADAIESFGIHTHVLAPDAEINRWNGAGNQGFVVLPVNQFLAKSDRLPRQAQDERVREKLKNDGVSPMGIHRREGLFQHGE
jgi:hypothetical protein